jgi:hypothetical protein
MLDEIIIEILCNILNNLSDKDLKIFRMTSKRMLEICNIKGFCSIAIKGIDSYKVLLEFKFTKLYFLSLDTVLISDLKIIQENVSPSIISIQVLKISESDIQSSRKRQHNDFISNRPISNTSSVEIIIETTHAPINYILKYLSNVKALAINNKYDEDTMEIIEREEDSITMDLLTKLHIELVHIKSFVNLSHNFINLKNLRLIFEVTNLNQITTINNYVNTSDALRIVNIIFIIKLPIITKEDEIINFIIRKSSRIRTLKILCDKCTVNCIVEKELNRITIMSKNCSNSLILRKSIKNIIINRPTKITVDDSIKTRKVINNIIIQTIIIHTKINHYKNQNCYFDIQDVIKCEELVLHGTFCEECFMSLVNKLPDTIIMIHLENLS